MAPEIKTCKECQTEKPLSEFSPCGRYKNSTYYRGECKDCNRKTQRLTGKEAQKKYRESPKGRIGKHRYKKTRKYREQQTLYCKNRRYSDPKYKIRRLARIRLRQALKRKRWNKNHTFAEYIGCSLDQLKLHIESLFKPGMTWENHGEWHIDHRVPLDSAETEQDLYKLCHYTNLQPLWAFDNMSKGSKIS